MRFKNKTVIITGAAGGIGRQTALSFAKEGANVAVSDLDFDQAKRVADEITSAGGTAEPFKLDVTDQNETIEVMKNAYDHFGSLDIAFCNAGIREIVSPLELSIEEWRKVIDINVTGVFITAQTFAKKCIDLGCFFSLSGIITFKNANKLRDTIKILPIKKIIFETDSPYLTPVPLRGKINKPSYLKIIVEKYCEITGNDYINTCGISTYNYKKLFKIND